MTGPGTETGKGKGKVKARDGGDGSSVAKPAADATPRPGQRPESGKAVALIDYAMSSLCSSDPPAELPRKKTVCIFAATVAVLAVCRSILLPIPSVGSGSMSAPAVISGEQQDNLVRLVLTEELRGVVEQIEAEDRAFDALLKRQAGALDEIKGFEDLLKTSSVEIRELEGLGKTLHEDNSGDAGLSTEVSARQDKLRDLHLSVTDTLDGFEQRLSEQSETMMRVRRDVLDTKGTEERAAIMVAAAAAERLEAMVQTGLADLDEYHDKVDERLDEVPTDLLTKAELESLLEDAARPADRRDEERAVVVDLVQEMSPVAVEVALDMAATERFGCISEERVREEVDSAIKKMGTDGTGFRDYANANVGGSVIESLASETYTPASWWGSSRYWHAAGVENGIGPVTSVISEDSNLGACWAMKGSEGHVTIQLAQEVTVGSVSLEHASRMVTLESSSAPREFQVFGMRNEADTFPVRLGGNVYEIEGRPIQTFPIEPKGRKFPIIQIRFLSNWGNPDYTCVYRVRVHGRESYSG